MQARKASDRESSARESSSRSPQACVLKTSAADRLHALQEHEIHVADSNPVTPVATLRPTRFEFVRKASSDVACETAARVVQVPAHWRAPQPVSTQPPATLQAPPGLQASASSPRVFGEPASGLFTVQAYGSAAPPAAPVDTDAPPEATAAAVVAALTAVATGATNSLA
jgi:hypothetical protein